VTTGRISTPRRPGGSWRSRNITKLDDGPYFAFNLTRRSAGQPADRAHRRRAGQLDHEFGAYRAEGSASC